MRKSIFAKVAVAIAGLGLLAPATPAFAADSVPAATVRHIGTDVVLRSGQLNGIHVDSQGKAIAGAAVVVGQRGEEVGRTVTDANGQFRLDVRPGIYEVQIGEWTETVRVWSAEVAPPSARQSATVVAGNAVRGQFSELDMVGFTAMGIGTAGLIIGIIALDRTSTPQSP
ncbi:MAG: carboxypeptidase regulatory-like domain-containing protein [Planctomycetaceae bacterium]|nr:carboxypeptidase regulatory-like domain-containing protein [Planctomycetaceae bacterium]MCA9046933.1 carboxypeptidase regulatory-like domain-containing protein [Planctomycetaceae bacterium]